MKSSSNSTITFRGSGRSRYLHLVFTILSMFVLLGMLSTSVLGAPSARNAEDPNAVIPVMFSTSRIDAPRMFENMSSRSLRLDSNKLPHIAYGGDRLYYASYDGTAWHTEVVDDAPGVGSYASLALSSDDKPHISYYDARSGSLKYAFYTGTHWVVSFVDANPGSLSATAASPESFNASQPPLESSDLHDWSIKAAAAVSTTEPLAAVSKGVGLFTSIALDAFNHPSISYYDSINGSLKFAHWDGTAWDIKTVETDSNAGMYTSLALDGAGNPYISYYDVTYKGLGYAHNNKNGRLVASLIDKGTNRNVGQYTSIALDSSKKPYISYYDVGNGNLKYARLSDTKWISQTVDSAGDVGQYTSIAFVNATTIKPYIVYYGRSNDDLKYAHWNGSSWDIYVVSQTGTSGSVGRYASLALSGSSKLNISYFDSGSGELKFSSGAVTSWKTQTVDESADVGLYVSLAMDKNHKPGIGYLDNTHDDLRYAHWNGSSWDIQIVDTKGVTGLDTSLAYDASGNPHISYYAPGQEKIKYASWTGSAWLLQDVTTVSSSTEVSHGMGTSLDLDSAGNARIAFFDGKTKAMKVAFQTGSSWVIRVVEDTDDVGRYPSLKVDNQGYVHVSYYNATSKTLRYAKGTPDGSSWDKTRVDSGFSVGLYTSIALDNANQPHIAYFNDNGDNLKYANFDSSGWHTQVVDSLDITGINPSLALDNNGMPGISYYNQSRKDLRFAHWNGSAWVTQTVDSGDVGFYSSLSFDENGFPVIGYYDAANGDLKYASSGKGISYFLPFLVR
ncbi:MAG: hypothetical protein ACM3PY_19740 [Omnitrophica WOR_2 bacterium]